jgi:hypothetical protein
MPTLSVKTRKENCIPLVSPYFLFDTQSISIPLRLIFINPYGLLIVKNSAALQDLFISNIANDLLAATNTTLLPYPICNQSDAPSAAQALNASNRFQVQDNKPG